MSETLDIEPLASPDLSTPWVPLWPLAPTRLGELAYAERTTPVNITATVAPVVTAPAVTCDGNTPLLIEFFALSLGIVSAGAQAYVSLRQDGTSIGVIATATEVDQRICYGAKRVTPPAGSHVFSIDANTGGSGTAVLQAGTGAADQFVPAFIRVSLAAPLLSAPPGAAVPVQYGTSLPTNPLDGQEAILVDSLTNPTYQWRFRYNAGSTSPYKWEFVGGAPVFRTVAVQESTAVAGSWVNLATVGPSFTIPRAGDYDIEGQCSFQDTAVNDCYLGIGLGDHTSGAYVQLSIRTPADAAILNALSAFGVGTPASVGELRMKYYQSVAGTMYVSDRRLRVTPRRVS